MTVTASSIASFRSLNIPIAISHCSFHLKVMDDWQTQNKSLRYILHLPSIDMQVVETYDELITYNKVRNS